MVVLVLDASGSAPPRSIRRRRHPLLLRAIIVAVKKVVGQKIAFALRGL